MIILPYGDNALLINLDQRIDELINAQVTGLNDIIKTLPEVTYTIPAYCSLTVGYDVQKTDFEALKALIGEINLKAGISNAKKSVYQIPVCYEENFAPDLEGVMEYTGLSKAEIIESHTASAFRVYMIGFLAGFAYLGSLPKALYCPRRSDPRAVVPEGSVGLAGYQTGIYPTDAPGGWQLIGKTPVPTFRPHEATPALLKPGVYVKFSSIDKNRFEEIAEEVKAGTYEQEVIYG